MDSKNDPERCNVCNVLLEIQKKKNKRVVIRRAIDPVSNKLLVMCNACGLRLSRAGWRNKREPVKAIAPVEKEVCLKEFDVFKKALCDVLQDGNASRLYCPALSPKLCQCIQQYLVRSDGGKTCTKQLIKGSAENIDKEKATELNELNKKAKLLIKQKADKPADQNLTTNKMKGILNLRSKEYEQFVLINRERLKKVYNLCERGVQRILCYSNNYLHKQLKTSPNGEARIASKSRVVARLLPDIKTLFEKRCCSQRCTRLALTHSQLIEQWREKALSGQRDARTVLAEMLTPTSGTVNCSAFLRLVTGCSSGLLYKVKKDMAKSAGVREPPEHGLRKYWRHKKIITARNCDSSSKNITESDVYSSAATDTCRQTAATTDSSNNIDEKIQTRKPNILRKKSSAERKDADKSTNSLFVNINRSTCENEKIDVNVNSTARLSDTVIQNWFGDDINNGNCSEDNVALALPILSSDIIDCNQNVNIAGDSCINQMSMIPYILTSGVNTTDETNSSTVDKDSDVNGQRVQFIEITKLASSDPPTSREDAVTVPLMLVIS